MNGRNLTTALSILVVGLMATSTGALAGGDRLECDADSATGGASMDARFEAKDGRNKFDASFEVAPGGTLQAGHVLQVNVAGEILGEITLAVQPNGDLGGDLEFDTNVDQDEPDTTVPFPTNWPDAKAGTIVKVGTLGCSLQS